MCLGLFLFLFFANLLAQFLFFVWTCPLSFLRNLDSSQGINKLVASFKALWPFSPTPLPPLRIPLHIHFNGKLANITICMYFLSEKISNVRLPACFGRIRLSWVKSWFLEQKRGEGRLFSLNVCSWAFCIVKTGLAVRAKLTVRPPGNLLVLEVCTELYPDSETPCLLGSGSQLRRRVSCLL